MPIEVMSLEDIRQKFDTSVVMYKRQPVLFKKIAADRSCRIFKLLEQVEEQVPFVETDFQPPAPRIGMVNIRGSVLYVARNPIRRYKLGLNKENISIKALNVKYPDGRSDDYTRCLIGLDRKELGYALLNKYPTFKQAVRLVSQFEGAAAFDKQFCVDSSGYVYYKTNRVGTHDGSLITFSEGCQHLENLLGKGYEKSR